MHEPASHVFSDSEYAEALKGEDQAREEEWGMAYAGMCSTKCMFSLGISCFCSFVSKGIGSW